jgi:drug/metabolite transporter (DMT)-like permease
MWLVFFCFALFASGIFVNKLILFSMSPAMLSGLRMLISGIIIIVGNWQSYKSGMLRKILENWKVFFGITLFTNLFPTLLKAYAVQNMGLSKAGFLGSIDPFITAFYAYILINEKLSMKKWVGILLGFCGAVMLFSVKSPVEDALGTFLNISYPSLAAIASVAISRLGWMFVQKEMRKNDFSAFDINGVVMTGAGLFAFASIPLWNFLGISKEAFSFAASLDLKLFMLLTYTIIAGNLLAYNLYSYLLKHNSATLVSLAGATVPIYLTLLGYFFLGEPITKMLIGSAGIIILGVFVFYYDDMMKDKNLLKDQ